MVIVLDGVFNTLVATSGSTVVSLRIGFVLLFATQLAFRGEFSYPSNFLNRVLPLYSPFPFIIVPDNACQRSYFKSPLTFDFVVVGAGPAGSVIANRLSENPNRRVLLIEAGGDPLTDSVIPQWFPFLINGTNVWKYNAEVSSVHSNAYKYGCPSPFGKQLGGSSETNAMLYVCGNDRDYNSWSTAGNVGWDYNSMLPLIKRTERNLDTSRDPAYHGFTGRLQVSNYAEKTSFGLILEAAFNELGYETLPDYNAKAYNGFVRLQTTISGGERFGAYRAFIQPAKNRPNFFVMKNSLVTNVIFSGTKAVGVNVKTAYSTCVNITISATKEVILSAGAFGSPKILMQSGIGKPADLKLVGITSRKDLSVGYNYRDHVFSVHFFKINPDAPTQTVLQVAEQAMQYFYNRTGEFAQVGTLNTNGFINTIDPSATYPDVQMSFYHFPKNQQYIETILANFGFKDEFIEQLILANTENELVMAYNILLNPKSTGTVKLRDRNPDSKPIIEANYLSNVNDVDTLIRGANRLVDLIYSEAMAPYRAELWQLYVEECDGLDFGTDDYWKCHFKYFTQNLWHPTGTCKMGPASDPTAVVDPTLKVKGFTSLRVADNSVLPTVPSGNTQCQAYAVGQKAADLIIKAWP